MNTQNKTEKKVRLVIIPFAISEGETFEKFTEDTIKQIQRGVNFGCYSVETSRKIYELLLEEEKQQGFSLKKEEVS